jgi:hypothetical protein
MTIKERFMQIYRRGKPDMFGFGIYARYLPTGDVERQVRNAGLGIIKYVPLTSQMSPPWHLLPGYLSQVKNTNITIKYIWEKGHFYEKRIYETPVGTVFAEIEESKGAGSEHIRCFYIKGIEDYEIMQYIVENSMIEANEGLYLTAEDNLGEDGVVLGRLDRTPYQKLLLELRGAEEFFLDMADEPEIVDKLIGAMNQKYREQFKLAMNSRAQVIWIPDNVTVDMTPPKLFEKYHLPLYKHVVESAHQAGKIVAAHFDGKARPLLPYLRQIGFDVIESVSDPMIGGDMGYAEWCNALPETVILPNFPSNLCLAKDGVIINYINKLKELSGDRPFMLQISEDLSEGTWKRIIPLVTKAIYG